MYGNMLVWWRLIISTYFPHNERVVNKDGLSIATRAQEIILVLSIREKSPRPMELHESWRPKRWMSNDEHRSMSMSIHFAYKIPNDFLFAGSVGASECTSLNGPFMRWTSIWTRAACNHPQGRRVRVTHQVASRYLLPKVMVMTFAKVCCRVACESTFKKYVNISLHLRCSSNFSLTTHSSIHSSIQYVCLSNLYIHPATYSTCNYSPYLPADRHIILMYPYVAYGCILYMYLNQSLHDTYPPII